MSATTTDIRVLKDKLQKTPKAYSEFMDKFMTEEARTFVKLVVDATPPGSQGVKGMAAKKKGEEKVDSDISAIFAPVVLKGTRTITHLFGDEDPNVGKKPPYVVKTVEQNPDVEAIYKTRSARRTNGKMTRGKVAAFYVSAQKLRQLKTKKKKNVGYLAAGYNAAANRLGVKLPAWVTRHGSRFGHVEVNFSGGNIGFKITNSVPYGASQQMQRIADSALRIVHSRALKRLPYALKGAIKKAGFAA